MFLLYAFFFFNLLVGHKAQFRLLIMFFNLNEPNIAQNCFYIACTSLDECVKNIHIYSSLKNTCLLGLCAM
jgi:hypothetical protein